MAGREIHVDVAIIGAGTAGLNAMREVRKAGKSFLLIDHGPLGTTCARVGCMPSKAVLHAGSVWQARFDPAGAGGQDRVSATEAGALWNAARRTRDMLAAGAAKRTVAAAGEHLLMGQAQFVAPSMLDVDGTRVTASAFVIATGSQPVLPGFLAQVQDRVLTTDTLFEREALPRSLGILGLGAIGLEIGLALSRLGVRVVAGDIKSVPAGIADPEIALRATQHFSAGSNLTMWLGRKIDVERAGEGLFISNGHESRQVDCLLAALGRRPAVKTLRLDNAGIALDDDGQPSIDRHTMRAGASSIYFAGDVDPDRPLMHEAADEGAIAGFNAAHHGAPQRFRRRVAMSIVFSEPDIAAVGMPFDRIDLETAIVGSASGDANGRSRILGAEHGMVRIYAERSSGKLLGASLFATRGEHLAHLLACAIQSGMTAEQMLELPFYHPTIEEMVQSALHEILKQQGGSKACLVGLPLLDSAR